MNSKVINAIVFITGAAVGSVVTWKLVKTKYENIANEEIASVKEAFSAKEINTKKEESTPEDEEEEEDSKPIAYSEIINDLGYNKTEVKDKKEDAMNNHAYVIPPEDFGEGDYGGLYLTYYEDNVLAYDVTGQVVKDVNDLVGPGALNHFGEYEDNMLWIRNDKDRVDLEIARSLKKYSEVTFEDSHSDDEDLEWDETL